MYKCIIAYLFGNREISILSILLLCFLFLFPLSKLLLSFLALKEFSNLLERDTDKRFYLVERYPKKQSFSVASSSCAYTGAYDIIDQE